jgi:phosphomannomutase
MVLSAVEGGRIKELFEARTFRRASWKELGKASECSQAGEWHCGRVLELVNSPGIRARRLRVFLDANGGAGGPLGHRLLDAFACQAVCHACSADGHFRHEPEPVLANLREICPLVKEHRADVGFVLDPDADRLALIDESGRYIGEELTLALAVLFRLRQERGPIVLNMSTSRVCEDIAKQYGCPCSRAAVGEANVVEKMREVGAVIGGEGNGGVIDPRVGWVRDPFIGMGLILNLLADTGKTLSQLVAELPTYCIIKDKYAVDRDRLPELFQALKQRWPEAAANQLDGLRLDWQDRWVHVRPSNTEPIVRVIAEAPRAEEATRLCGEVGVLLRA